MKTLVRLVLVAAAVFGAQRLWQHQRDLLAVEHDLAGGRREIRSAESEIETLDRTLDASEGRLAEMKEKLSSIERAHPNGIPQNLYDDYARLLAEHNDAVAEHNALVARHDALRQDYAARVDRHNERVEDANAFAATGGLCAVLPSAFQPSRCKSDR